MSMSGLFSLKAIVLIYRVFRIVNRLVLAPKVKKFQKHSYKNWSTATLI